MKSLIEELNKKHPLYKRLKGTISDLDNIQDTINDIIINKLKTNDKKAYIGVCVDFALGQSLRICRDIINDQFKGIK